MQHEAHKSIVSSIQITFQAFLKAYLREKNDLMQKWKMEEMQLQKQRLEAESKKEEQSKKKHQDLMQVMLQQTKQQQEQMQNF